MLHTTPLHTDGLDTITAIHPEPVGRRIDGLDELTTSDRVLLLSPRERELFELFPMGLSNQEVADRLFLSVNTVRNYTQTILDKLGVRNKVAAAVLAARIEERQRHTGTCCSCRDRELVPA